MKCTFHPDTETNLKCGKCEKPICPKCMVMTPVGARCRECAKLYKLPTYRVSLTNYLIATATGTGVAIAVGCSWALIYKILALVIPFFYFNWLLGAGAGYICAETISLAVNKKRGIGLGVIAAAAFCLSYVFGLILPWGFYFSLFDIIAIGAGIFVSVSRLR